MRDRNEKEKRTEKLLKTSTELNLGTNEKIAKMVKKSQNIIFGKVGKVISYNRVG